MHFLRIDPHRDLGKLRRFLIDSDPDDYLLTDLPEWIESGRLWVGEVHGEWVAFGRLHDLGNGEAWVSGIRVTARQRGHGLGRLLLEGILDDARAAHLTEIRAVIEEENHPSRRLFGRFGFEPAFEMALRRGLARPGSSPGLRPVRRGQPLPRPVGWLPGRTGRSDLLPGSDGGRFGRWRPSLLDRWTEEGKLYAGAGIAAAVQLDWWSDPRTLWVNPLQGDVSELFPALGHLAADLGHAEWQAFLPSTEALRREYDSEGALRHAAWGDRVVLYERLG